MPRSVLTPCSLNTLSQAPRPQPTSTTLVTFTIVSSSGTTTLADSIEPSSIASKKDSLYVLITTTKNHGAGLGFSLAGVAAQVARKNKGPRFAAGRRPVSNASVCATSKETASWTISRSRDGSPKSPR
jgi:hypothetical protein